jgi:hypothetical protein
MATRLRLVSLTGTGTTWQCPAGHITRRDYGRGPASRRIPAAALAALASRAGWWRDGVYATCPRCRKESDK